MRNATAVPSRESRSQEERNAFPLRTRPSNLSGECVFPVPGACLLLKLLCDRSRLRHRHRAWLSLQPPFLLAEAPFPGPSGSSLFLTNVLSVPATLPVLGSLFIPLNKSPWLWLPPGKESKCPAGRPPSLRRRPPQPSPKPYR